MGEQLCGLLPFRITQPLLPHAVTSNKASRAMSPMTRPGQTQSRRFSVGELDRGWTRAVSEIYTVASCSVYTGALLNQLFLSDKAISKAKPSNAALVYSERAWMSPGSGLWSSPTKHKPCNGLCGDKQGVVPVLRVPQNCHSPDLSSSALPPAGAVPT